MTNENMLNVDEEIVHPFLVILAVILRATHPLDTGKFIWVHGVCFAQYTQLVIDNGDDLRRFPGGAVRQL